MICNKSEDIKLKIIHGKYKYELIEPLTYIIKDRVIVVPKGFLTDGNTVPRLFWSIYPPLNKALRAAILHDYMYENAIFTKEIADKIYRDCCDELGVNKQMKYLAYLCIKFKGKGNY